MYRQGDILFIKLAEDAVESDFYKESRDASGNLVIAHGELTGHMHRIKEFQADVFSSPGGTRFLKADADVRVLHEEHGTINLPKGVYEIRQQRQWENGPVPFRD